MSEAELSREQVMNRRFELDSAIAILQGKHKAELEPLQEELRMCEQFIKAQMTEGNEQQYKLANGHQCFFVSKDSVKVGNWDEALQFIRENNEFGLLNQALNKTAVKEFIEANKKPPPGAEYVSFRDLSWRRGKVA